MSGSQGQGTWSEWLLEVAFALFRVAVFLVWLSLFALFIFMNGKTLLCSVISTLPPFF